MQYFLVFVAFIISSKLHASYLCKGPIGTPLESFTIHKISEMAFEATLDGRLNFVTEIDNDTLEFIFNNECDNDGIFRVKKFVFYSLPRVFSMRADFYNPDALLTDVSLICYQELL